MGAEDKQISKHKSIHTHTHQKAILRNQARTHG